MGSIRANSGDMGADDRLPWRNARAAQRRHGVQMQSQGWIGGLLAGLAAVCAATPALAQGATPPQTCAGKALGVSRVLEIDTTGGPRFGHQQYKDNDILRDKEVILTFDDGPLRPYTKPVLEALAAHCTRATFFMVGRQALADPEMAREVARRGHTIATHTYSHQNMRAIGASRAKVEIEQGFSAVRRAIGAPIAPFFRFPFLADSQAMMEHLRERNIAMFSIDVDAIDYRAREGATVHRNVMVDLLPRRKGIILFHDIQPSTAAAIRAVLDDLAAKGFKVVHIVPKAPVATLASFDASAESEAQKRSKAVAANPMVQRSLTWPMAPPAKAPVDQFRGGAGGQPPAYSKAAPAAADKAQPPVPAVAAPPPPPAAADATEPPAARPALRGSASEDWRARIFNN